MSIYQKPKNKNYDLLVREVYNDMLQGATYSVLVNKIVDGCYSGCEGVQYTNKSAQSLVSKLKRQIKADFAEERECMKERLVTMLMDVYTECREMGDRSNAIKAVETIGKYTGAVDPIKIDSSVKGEIVINFLDDNVEENGKH